MENEARAWNQRFRDEVLERTYQDEAATRMQRNVRIIMSLQSVYWLLLVLLDREIAGSPANYRVIVAVRLAALPVLAAALVCVWASPATFRRWKDRAVGAELVLVALSYAMALVVPEPLRFDPYSASGAQAAALVGIPILCAVWALRFDANVAFAPIFAAGATGVAVRYPAPGVGVVLFSALASMATGLIGAWIIDRTKRDAFVAQRAVARERERSEGLVRNMLPGSVAERLKASPGRIAEQHDAVTVLFADIAGFTPLSAELTAAELVDTLDEIFSAFDELAQRHGLEKIKTVGDAYMAVAGAPEPRADHAHAAAAMALDMRDLVDGRRFAGGRQLRMRIGLHTGPAVAGVIGTRKFVYDLWGDTVNTASRMESHGVPGAVQVSEVTYQLVRDGFELTPRGTIDIKGKGAMTTWFLDGRHSR